MQDQLQQILQDFRAIPEFDQADDWGAVEQSFSEDGHPRPRPLRTGETAVYAFFRGRTWLRIGQTSYSTRFTSQHYGTRRAKSTFAKDIWRNRGEFQYEGREEDIGEWIQEVFGRANLILPARWPPTVPPLLEAYLHYRLNPRFEGRRN